MYLERFDDVFIISAHFLGYLEEFPAYGHKLFGFCLSPGYHWILFQGYRQPTSWHLHNIIRWNMGVICCSARVDRWPSPASAMVSLVIFVLSMPLVQPYSSYLSSFCPVLYFNNSIHLYRFNSHLNVSVMLCPTYLPNPVLVSDSYWTCFVHVSISR